MGCVVSSLRKWCWVAAVLLSLSACAGGGSTHSVGVVVPPPPPEGEVGAAAADGNSQGGLLGSITDPSWLGDTRAHPLDDSEKGVEKVEMARDTEFKNYGPTNVMPDNAMMANIPAGNVMGPQGAMGGQGPLTPAQDQMVSNPVQVYDGQPIGSPTPSGKALNDIKPSDIHPVW